MREKKEEKEVEEGKIRERVRMIDTKREKEEKT